VSARAGWGRVRDRFSQPLQARNISTNTCSRFWFTSVFQKRITHRPTVVFLLLLINPAVDFDHQDGLMAVEGGTYP
jgi:hypothetical protein